MAIYLHIDMDTQILWATLTSSQTTVCESSRSAEQAWTPWRRISAVTLLPGCIGPRALDPSRNTYFPQKDAQDDHLAQLSACLAPASAFRAAKILLIWDMPLILGNNNDSRAQIPCCWWNLGSMKAQIPSFINKSVNEAFPANAVFLQGLFVASSFLVSFKCCLFFSKMGNFYLKTSALSPFGLGNIH